MRAEEFASPQKRGRVCEWRVVGLKPLARAVEGALCAEDAAASELAEAEGLPVADAEAAEAALGQLQRSVLRYVVAPLQAEGVVAPEEEQALSELPGLVEELAGQVRQAWQLAQATGQSRQQLAKGLAAAKADALAQGERVQRAEAALAAAREEAGQTEEAQQLLERDASERLASSREAVRRLEQELAERDGRAEQLEREGEAQSGRIRQLEAEVRAARSEAFTIAVTTNFYTLLLHRELSIITILFNYYY